MTGTTGPGQPPPESGPPPATVPGPPLVTPPSRLSPRTLLIDPLRVLPSLLVPLAGVLFVGGFSPSSFFWAGLAVLGSVGYAVVRWLTFTYRVVDDRLELTRALISRSVRTIPLERVRGVDITTPPLHRLLGIAVLRVDTGASGGQEQEGELNALSVAEAERLKEVLLRRAPLVAHQAPEGPERPGESREQAGPPAPPAERVHARIPRAWLRYGPLSGAYLLTPFALAGGAVGVVFQAGRELRIDERVLWGVGEWLWERPVLLVVAAVALVLAMPIAGGVMYAVFNWDFTLLARNGYLLAERGLFTRRSVSLERRRVRGYELVDGIVERWAGAVRAWAIVTGLGDAAGRGQLLPVVPRAFALPVLAEAVWPFTAPLTPHPPAARRRRLFRAVAPWAAVAAVAFVLGWYAVGALAVLLAGLGVPLALDRYRSLGHAYDGVRLSVRSGSLRRAQAVIEREAVVGWTVRQTWFQRRAGVLTVIAGVGAGSGGYAAVDAGERQGVAFAARVSPAWLGPFLTAGGPSGAEGPAGGPEEGRR